MVYTAPKARKKPKISLTKRYSSGGGGGGGVSERGVECKLGGRGSSEIHV